MQKLWSRIRYARGSLANVRNTADLLPSPTREDALVQIAALEKTINLGYIQAREIYKCKTTI